MDASANVALAVNPELDYAFVKCERFERPLVMAKFAIKHVEGEKHVLLLLKGNELIGLEYETFFPDLPVQKDSGANFPVTQLPVFAQYLAKAFPLHRAVAAANMGFTGYEANAYLRLVGGEILQRLFY